jgi:hypothetical protein
MASPDAASGAGATVATFVPRPMGRCFICNHAAPKGVETCTQCLSDYGLPTRGVA